MNVRLASLAVAALATAGLAVTAPAVADAAPSGATHSAAADITYCPYQVNATDVYVRSAPSKAGNVVTLVSKPKKGLASQNTYSGSGLLWRKGFGGYVAAEYLTRVAGACAQ